MPSATFVEARLEDPLPPGPFDLVVSPFTVHNLSSAGKADLFKRVAAVLGPHGRVVLATWCSPHPQWLFPFPSKVDLPDTAADQADWLTKAGSSSSIVFAAEDIAILRAEDLTAIGRPTNTTSPTPKSEGGFQTTAASAGVTAQGGPVTVPAPGSGHSGPMRSHRCFAASASSVSSAACSSDT